MNKLRLCLLLLPSLALSQITYNSKASEYIFEDLPSSIAEMIERDILITEETILIKSYGKKVTDIQTWSIQSKTYADSENKAYTIYHTELKSGEKNLYPATFTLQFNSEGEVETITCVIPPNNHLNLPENAPTKVRFIID